MCAHFCANLVSYISISRRGLAGAGVALACAAPNASASFLLGEIAVHAQATLVGLFEPHARAELRFGDEENESIVLDPIELRHVSRTFFFASGSGFDAFSHALTDGKDGDISFALQARTTAGEIIEVAREGTTESQFKVFDSLDSSFSDLRGFAIDRMTVTINEFGVRVSGSNLNYEVRATAHVFGTPLDEEALIPSQGSAALAGAAMLALAYRRRR